jgi:hypothetical protein
MKRKILWMLLVIALLCAPTAAFAYQLDDYGLDLNNDLFVGTLENWDNFFYGRPAHAPLDPSTKDVMFLERQWNKDFGNLMFGDGTPVEGAYCATNGHINYSDGSVYQEFMVFAFAFEQYGNTIPVDPVSMPGFYFVTMRAWLTDADGNTTTLHNFNASFDGKMAGSANKLKALAQRNFTFKGNYTVGVK